MRIALVRAVAVFAAVVSVTGLLAGCAPAVPSAKSTPAHASPSAHPTAAPTSNSTAALPTNVLLRITATVTAPGGAAADLVQTVYLPTAPTPAQVSQLNTDCTQKGEAGPSELWSNNFSSALMLTSITTATLQPGSPAWDNSQDPVTAGFIGLGDFTGAYSTWEAYCAPGFLTVPGTQLALGPIQAADPSGQPDGWAGASADFGFFSGGNDPSDGELSGDAVVSHCVIQLSATAAASSVAAKWAADAPGYAVPDGCEFRGPQS